MTLWDDIALSISLISIDSIQARKVRWRSQ
jgi:hypothetical protein